MQIFDTVSKNYVQTYAPLLLQDCLNLAPETEIVVLEHLSTELPKVDMRKTDSVIKARIGGQEMIAHFEFQTTDSTHAEMGLRMAGYMIRLIETYNMPVYSTVIYLRPDAGKRDTGVYHREFGGVGISASYQVLRLIEMDGQEVLDAGLTGLIPFAPLMKRPPGIGIKEWMRIVLRAAKDANVRNKPAYMGTVVAMGSLILDKDDIIELLREGDMNQPDIITYWTAEATESATRETTIKSILAVLAHRLAPEVAVSLRPTIEQIEDMQHLEYLLLAAAVAESTEDFRKALANNGGSE